MATEENTFLHYKIFKWSSYSSYYVPENILYNKPNQQSSRWSSSTNSPPQYLLLKLMQPAIVRTIMFGKYEKNHVCNIKKFKILGGMEENNLIELYKGGLKNDHNPETFHLKHKIEGQIFPCKFIKIVPLLSWGSAFNFSIWYIELQGTNSSELVQPCLQWYYQHREHEAIRLCLKHFRQHNYVEAFQTLQRRTKINLEHPLLTELHKTLVIDGDFDQCEKLIEQAIAEDLFSHYIGSQEYSAQWNSITLKSVAQPHGSPGMRGGHQMCMDHINNHVYLLGGWDGSQDLADFWRFEVDRSVWVCLSHDTEIDGGPSARSCHKICIDSENGKIYTLGRYLDSLKRTATSVQNDFHVYHINEGRWELISRDTSLNGGPRLIFDHQMCIDQLSQMIYVFGGRILVSSSSFGNNERPLPEFSGLYRYHIPTNSWQLLREDSGNAGPQDVRSRIGHSMLLDTVGCCTAEGFESPSDSFFMIFFLGDIFNNPLQEFHSLYIFGGQRSKEYINDFFIYDIEQDSVTVLQDGTRKDYGLPPAGFTQRATINSDLSEIYMLSGLSKDKEKREDNLHNSFWVYSIRNDKWTCVYRNEASSLPAGGSRSHPVSADNEPCPRYAHQLVYDHVRQMHYMFGGNPGSKSSPKTRLADFWNLKLLRPTKADILKKCQYLIRRHRFREETMKDPVAALTYLQNQVSETVVHENAHEEREFRLLASSLFGACNDDSDEETIDTNQSSIMQDGSVPGGIASSSKESSAQSSYLHLKHAEVDDCYVERTKLYDALVAYFPEEMRQPSGNLVDLITF